jgi:hypothetical protein
MRSLNVTIVVVEANLPPSFAWTDGSRKRVLQQCVQTQMQLSFFQISQGIYTLF